MSVWRNDAQETPPIDPMHRESLAIGRWQFGPTIGDFFPTRIDTVTGRVDYYNVLNRQWDVLPGRGFDPDEMVHDILQKTIESGTAVSAPPPPENPTAWGAVPVEDPTAWGAVPVIASGTPVSAAPPPPSRFRPKFDPDAYLAGKPQPTPTVSGKQPASIPAIGQAVDPADLSQYEPIEPRSEKVIDANSKAQFATPNP